MRRATKIACEYERLNRTVSELLFADEQIEFLENAFTNESFEMTNKFHVKRILFPFRIVSTAQLSASSRQRRSRRDEIAAQWFRSGCVHCARMG